MADATVKLRSRRSRAYQKMFPKLPERIRELAIDTFKIWSVNPSDPRLTIKPLGDNRKGRHRSNSSEIYLTKRYRAIFVKDNGKNGNEPEQYFWYWIGSHSDANIFTGSRLH